MKAAPLSIGLFVGLFAAVLCAETTLPQHQLTAVPYVMEWKSFTEMNDAFADRFVSKKGFGFSRMIDLERMKTITIAGKPYRIGKVQLIGIAEHPAPVLYQTHADANKESIKKAKTRLLTSAESDALRAIQAGKQWTMTPKNADVDGAHRVMVGELRARQSCMKCHEDAKVGDLLGAFRYQIIPSIPILQAPPKENLPQTPLSLNTPHAG